MGGYGTIGESDSLPSFGLKKPGQVSLSLVHLRNDSSALGRPRKASARLVGSRTCTQHRSNLDPIVSRRLPRQNIEHRLDVCPELRQRRQAYDYKACMLKRRDVLGSDDIARRLVRHLSPTLHFDAYHISPIALAPSRALPSQPCALLGHDLASPPSRD